MQKEREKRRGEATASEWQRKRVLYSQFNIMRWYNGYCFHTISICMQCIHFHEALENANEMWLHWTQRGGWGCAPFSRESNRPYSNEMLRRIESHENTKPMAMLFNRLRIVLCIHLSTITLLFNVYLLASCLHNLQ